MTLIVKPPLVGRIARRGAAALAAGAMVWSAFSAPVAADAALADLVEKVSPAGVAVYVTPEVER
ncbi:MAG: hypothetical protein ACE5FS_06960, partial [Paracoccaceae bacterium]